MNAGGKRANQAVAAARLGGNVSFIAKIGNDVFGTQAVELFQSEGIDTSCIITDEHYPSGVALITVDANAEKGDPVLLFAGVACVAIAIIINAIAYKKKSTGNQKISTKGIMILLLLVC